MLNQQEHKDFVDNKFEGLRLEALVRLAKTRERLKGIKSPVLVDEAAHLLDMLFSQIALVESIIDYIDFSI